MVAEWFYQIGGQQSGPVDSRELRRLAEAGIVRPDILVRQGASGRWVHAEHVRGLFQRSTPPPSRSPGASPPLPPPVPKPGVPSWGVSGEGSIRPGLRAAAVNDAPEKPERIGPVTWAAIIVGSGTVLLLLVAAILDVGIGAHEKSTLQPEPLAAPQRAESAALNPAGPMRQEWSPLGAAETSIFDTSGHPNADGIQMRIAYPRTWKADNGDSPAAVQRFISDAGQGNQAVLIQVFARPKPYDRPLTRSEKQLLLAREQMQEAVGKDVTILSHEITTLDDEICAVSEWEQVIDAGDFMVGMKSLVFAVPLERCSLMISCYVQGDASAGVDAIRREYDSAKPLFLSIVNSCVFRGKQDVTAQTPAASYIHVQLAHGISLSVPRSWHVFGDDWNALIRQNALARTGDISWKAEQTTFGYTTILRIATGARQPYGSLAINVYDSPLLAPEIIREVMESADLLEQLRLVLHNETAGQAPGLLVGDTSINSLQVDGRPAIRFSYQRKSVRDGGIVQCHMMRVFLPDETYSIVWSCHVAASELLTPILDARIDSISIAEPGM